jgi:hypothetical protein
MGTEFKPQIAPSPSTFQPRKPGIIFSVFEYPCPEPTPIEDHSPGNGSARADLYSVTRAQWDEIGYMGRLSIPQFTRILKCLMRLSRQIIE